MYLCIFLSVCLPVRQLSVCLSIYRSIHLSVYHCLSIYLAMRPSDYLTIYLSFCLPVYLFYLSISFYLYISPSIYLSFYLKGSSMQDCRQKQKLTCQKRSNSARLPQKIEVLSFKTKDFRETSSVFEFDNIKNEAILRDFSQKIS